MTEAFTTKAQPAAPNIGFDGTRAAFIVGAGIVGYRHKCTGIFITKDYILHNMVYKTFFLLKIK